MNLNLVYRGRETGGGERSETWDVQHFTTNWPVLCITSLGKAIVAAKEQMLTPMLTPVLPSVLLVDLGRAMSVLFPHPAPVLIPTFLTGGPARSVTPVFY